MKTSELTGAALDWAVAKCEGRSEPEVVNNFAVAWYTWPNTHYSTNWALGGPIIERKGLEIVLFGSGWRSSSYWNEHTKRHVHVPMVSEFGSTPLIAAMRCYVASKLGENVDIPKELMQ